MNEESIHLQILHTNDTDLKESERLNKWTEKKEVWTEIQQQRGTWQNKESEKNEEKPENQENNDQENEIEQESEQDDQNETQRKQDDIQYTEFAQTTDRLTATKNANRENAYNHKNSIEDIRKDQKQVIQQNFENNADSENEKQKADVDMKANIQPQQRGMNTPPEENAGNVPKSSESVQSCEKVSNKDYEQIIKRKCLEPTSLEKALDIHLRFPDPLKKAKRGKENQQMPSAISSKAYRAILQKKELEKALKTEATRKRKENRAAARVKKQSMQVKRKRRTIKPLLNITKKRRICVSQNDCSKQPILCSLCDEALVSEAEEDSEKNIGCDHCIRWYHLKCSRFFGMPYAEAAVKDYKCELCD